MNSHSGKCVPSPRPHACLWGEGRPLTTHWFLSSVLSMPPPSLYSSNANPLGIPCPIDNLVWMVSIPNCAPSYPQWITNLAEHGSPGHQKARLSHPQSRFCQSVHHFLHAGGVKSALPDSECIWDSSGSSKKHKCLGPNSDSQSWPLWEWEPWCAQMFRSPKVSAIRCKEREMGAWWLSSLLLKTHTLQMQIQRCVEPVGKTAGFVSVVLGQAPCPSSKETRLQEGHSSWQSILGESYLIKYFKDNWQIGFS